MSAKSEALDPMGAGVTGGCEVLRWVLGIALRYSQKAVCANC